MTFDAETAYIASLVVANVSTAGLMFLLGNPLFTVALCTLGFVVVVGAMLSNQSVRRSVDRSR